jgi:hypothetical protein
MNEIRTQKKYITHQCMRLAHYLDLQYDTLIHLFLFFMYYIYFYKNIMYLRYTLY